jgi:predicted ATPase
MVAGVGLVLTRFSLANFRCFRAVDVPLRPLTVLVGPNDSGKSAFLNAISRTGYGLSQPDVRRGSEGEDAWFKALDDSGRPTGVLRTIVHRLPSTGLLTMCQGVDDAVGPPALAWDGSNIAAYLDYLLRRDRPRFFKIVDALKASINGLIDIEIATPNGQMRRLDFAFAGGFTLPGHEVSAGITLLTFFLALAHHTAPPDLVLIEEPENGVHPQRLAKVAELLRSLTNGSYSGHRTQVIVSTHSPYFLDHIRLPEDQVLVFRRAPDGTRTVEPADAEGLRSFLAEFMMGEIWFNRGEDGLVRAPAA